MKAKNILILASIALIYVLSGCVSFVYHHPTNTTPPKVENTGDLQVAGGISGSEHFTQYSLEGYYQYDNSHYVGLQVNLSDEMFPRDTYHFKAESNYFELSWGEVLNHSKHISFYYTPALGMGRVDNRYQGAEKSLNYLKYSVKGFTKVNSGLIDIGIGAQLSGMNFFNIYDNSAPLAAGTEYFQDLENLRSDPLCLTFQPLLSLGIGWRNVKLYGMYTYQAFLVGGHNIKHDPECISFTLSFMIPESFKIRNY